MKSSNKWKLLKDELPSETGVYLVSIGNVQTVAYYTGTTELGYSGWVNINTRFESCPTAWMNIPAKSEEAV